MSYAFCEGYKIRDQAAPHFLTFTVAGWIDVFSRQRYHDIILESFKFCRAKKGLKIGAYVIMSNHIHVIWTAANNNLSDIVREFKTHTSRAITRSIENDIESRKQWMLYRFKFYCYKNEDNDRYKFWTGNNHPEAIYSFDFLKTKLNYIHDNPVRAGKVEKQSHYLYSSAGVYEGQRGLLDIDLLF